MTDHVSCWCGRQTRKVGCKQKDLPDQVRHQPSVPNVLKQRNAGNYNQGKRQKRTAVTFR